jgi:tRNA-splicing ligase RtcB
VDITVLSHDDPQVDATPRVFDSEEVPADPEVVATLASGVSDIDLAAPPVVLPDFHHKADLEMPSSIAVATRNTIRPAFTSASVNCGMALIALDSDVPDEQTMTRFYDAVRARFPHPPSWRRELSMADVLRAADEGSAFGVDRFGLPAEALERVEEDGRLSLARYGGVERLKRELPRLSFHVSRYRFGSIGPSNHFVELQRVEEILDPVAAEVLGVSEGQLTLQYHAGGGLLTGQVGRLFARRQKMHGSLQLQMALARPLAHLTSARSAAQVRERLSLYFRPGCPVIPLDGPEGSRVMLANAAAMNYGFAFRAATYGTLVGVAREVFGARTSQLVVDSPHNSIYEEQVGGRPAIVHRHNSCRAYPASRMREGTAFGSVGQAVLLPGTHRTSSYLCVAGDHPERSLYSACHGAGTVVDKFASDGESASDHDRHSTLRYRYNGEAPTRVSHLDDRGVDAALRILVTHGLVRPVARMRPLAVLH